MTSFCAFVSCESVDYQARNQPRYEVPTHNQRTYSHGETKNQTNNSHILKIPSMRIKLTTPSSIKPLNKSDVYNMGLERIFTQEQLNNSLFFGSRYVEDPLIMATQTVRPKGLMKMGYEDLNQVAKTLGDGHGVKIYKKYIDNYRGVNRMNFIIGLPDGNNANISVISHVTMMDLPIFNKIITLTSFYGVQDNRQRIPERITHSIFNKVSFF